MTKIRSETKALQTYVALRDNTARFYRDEITHEEFHRIQIRLWDSVTPYDVCERCGRDIIDSEMGEEMLCQKCTQRFIDDCLEADAAQEAEELKRELDIREEK